MLTNDEESELKRLDFENFLWVVVICLAVANIVGDVFDQEYIKTKDWNYQNNANKIFQFTIVISLLIYLYYFGQNVTNYQNFDDENRHLRGIKILGSIFLIGGTLCLLYFQFNETQAEGAPDAI